MDTAELIWMDGDFVPWEDAKVHVLSHAFHYGTSVFEGERAYETAAGPAVFRHQDHLDRLEASAKLYYMELPVSKEQIRTATHELIVRNGLKSCYIRPIAFRGYGPMGLDPEENPVHVAVAVWEWGAYLGEEAKLNGVRAKVSSWRRISPQSLVPHAKAGGQYLNSVLAKIESKRAGYEEAILLDDKGHVCEGSGENVFIVRDGVLATPPQTASILDGISRKSVIEIAGDLGYEVVERDVARAELVLADEVFLVGTAAELTPVREIDDIDIGPPGEITRRIQQVYDDALHGRAERYAKWLDVVPVPSKA
jgi:branched-chain amino acid aminotransferase